MTTQSKTTRPKMTRPKTTRPKTTQSETTQSQTAQPKVTQPKASKACSKTSTKFATFATEEERDKRIEELIEKIRLEKAKECLTK